MTRTALKRSLSMMLVSAASLTVSASHAAAQEVDWSARSAAIYKSAFPDASPQDIAAATSPDRFTKTKTLRECLESNYPDSFSGIYTEHRPKYRTVVLMSGGGKAEAPLCAGTETLNVKKANHSLNKMRAAEKKLQKIMELPDSPVTGFAILTSENKILLEIKPGQSGKLTGLANAIIKSSPFVELVEGDRFSSKELAMIPGAQSIGNCSTAFSATKGSVQGTLTAAHCPSVMNVRGSN